MNNRSTSFHLGPEVDRYIADRVLSGNYASASEVVRAGLRALEAREVRVAALLEAIEEGALVGVPGATVDDLVEGLEPPPVELQAAVQWLERVASASSAELSASDGAEPGLRQQGLMDRITACSRVAEWLSMRARRRAALLRMTLETEQKS